MPAGNRGAAFEHLIEAQNRLYLMHGGAAIWKRAAGARAVRGAGGEVQARFTARGEPDFWGVLRGGVGVAFEAKECASPTGLDLVVGRRASLLRQLPNLAAVSRMGGLGFLLAWLPKAGGGSGRCFLLPVWGYSVDPPPRSQADSLLFWPAEVLGCSPLSARNGRRRLTLDELRHVGVEIPLRGLAAMVDWLPAARKAIAGRPREA